MTKSAAQSSSPVCVAVVGAGDPGSSVALSSGLVGEIARADPHRAQAEGEAMLSVSSRMQDF